MLTQQHHRRMVADYDENVARIAEFESVLASPERQRELFGTERGRYLAQHSDG
jgi:hypothetical protein